MNLRPLLLTAAAASLLALAGCVGGGSSQSAVLDAYSTACILETNARGSYVYGSGDTEVKPGANGTATEAAAINACIRSKAAESGTPLVAAPAGQTTEVEVVQGSVTETFTYGQPPAAPADNGAIDVDRCRSRNVMSGGSGYCQCTR
ncbi:MAG: hypothetical protein EAZ40_06465 [Rhodobacterales bacterium]|nr:MAG: hypothetical protein EAZ40_06465 [Rhodobacterales bacterium]